MIKVDQREVGKETGDCMRAAIASVLGVDIQTVPHITRVAQANANWFSVMYYFMVSHQYLYCGGWHPREGKRRLLKKHSFNGFYLASVNSRTYPPEEGITHMVVMDHEWKVAHDPHPNKEWQGETLWGNPDFRRIDKYRKMNDTDKQYWHYL